MRIMIAIHGFPPTHYAGAERAGERIARWLVQNGHDVEVFAIEQVDSPDFRLETSHQDGYVIHRLYYNLSQNDRGFENSYNLGRVGEALYDILSQKPFDLLHIISGYLLGAPVIHAAKNAGIPVVVTLTEYWYLCTRLNLIQPTGAICTGPESDIKCAHCLLEEKRRFRLIAQVAPTVMGTFWAIADHSSFVQEKTQMITDRRMILRDALNTADLVISPSRFLIQMYNQYGFDTSRYVFIRHGLNSPGHLAERSGTGNTLRIGYLGQLKSHKGIDLLIDAVLPLLKTGQNLQLDIWGPLEEDPAYTHRLQQQSAAYHQVHWRGRYQGGQLWEILSALDVLVVPSRWYENCPTVILEAFRAGLPVIATNLGGMAELVEHGKSGLLFETNNADDLRRQLERLLAEPHLVAQLRAGIPYIKTGDEEVEEIFAEYQKMIASRA